MRYLCIHDRLVDKSDRWLLLILLFEDTCVNHSMQPVLCSQVLRVFNDRLVNSNDRWMHLLFEDTCIKCSMQPVLRSQVLRVFHDRLVDDNDRVWICEVIKEHIQSHFRMSVPEVLGRLAAPPEPGEEESK